VEPASETSYFVKNPDCGQSSKEEESSFHLSFMFNSQSLDQDYQSNLQGSSVQEETPGPKRPLRTGPIGSTETSVIDKATCDK
jgi:hypothetical protein